MVISCWTAFSGLCPHHSRLTFRLGRKTGHPWQDLLCQSWIQKNTVEKTNCTVCLLAWRFDPYISFQFSLVALKAGSARKSMPWELHLRPFHIWTFKPICLGHWLLVHLTTKHLSYSLEAYVQIETACSCKRWYSNAEEIIFQL